MLNPNKKAGVERLAIVGKEYQETHQRLDKLVNDFVDCLFKEKIVAEFNPRMIEYTNYDTQKKIRILFEFTLDEKP